MLAIQSLLAVETERDPHAYYAHLRQHDPVHYDERAGTILQMAGREHASVRGMMSPYFRGRGLQSWLPLIEGTVRGLLDESVHTTVDGLVSAMARGTEVDLVPRFSNLLPVYVIAEVLGLPRSDHALFYGWYQAQSEFLSNLSRDPQVERRGERALRELREYLAPFVVRRRIEPGDDFIPMLAQAEVDDRRLTDEEVMTHATHLLNAGSETTDRTVTSLLSHLLAVPRRYAAVRDDRSLVLRAISETLRLTPPSQMNGRVTTEDVEIRGVRIPAGSFVLLVIASANRDERRFANATEFDMYGAMVARSELEISLNALLDAFPDMRLAPGSTVEERGLKMRSPQALRVVL